MDPKKLEQRQARTEAAVGRGGVRRDAAEARRARVAKSRAARAEREHDHDHEGPHTHDEDGNAIPIEDVTDDADLTDEVIEQAEADNPGEPEEAAVDEAAEEEAADEPEADASDEEQK
jgi:hypothetical protein